MSITLATSPDPGKLRPLLHAALDQLSDEHLGLAHRALLEIELHQLAGELDDAANSMTLRMPPAVLPNSPLRASPPPSQNTAHRVRINDGLQIQPITLAEFVAKHL